MLTPWTALTAGQKAAAIALLVIAIPLLAWIGYSAGYWVGSTD